jgi:hypothetical protein
VLDGPGAWWQVPLPYTLIVDGSAVAIVHSETDTATVAATLRRLDPATIKVIDILRGPQAQKEYPAAVGTVVRVSRCH